MRLTGLMLVTLLLTGCDDMTEQPKTRTYGNASGMPATPPAGTVSAAAPEPPPALSTALLARGREEFHIYCAPCHGETGEGDGMIVQRGFSKPPSYHDEARRRLEPAEIYRVISDGRGAMYGFAARIFPADRWAVVAYVKALQRSRTESVADLTPEERSHLP